jgi:aspartyl-tRNA(Asn)/glutamyl-tRNA(Gln) amidotransferase subunit A
VSESTPDSDPSTTQQFMALSEQLSCFAAIPEPAVLPQHRSPGVLNGASLGIKDLFDLPGFATGCGGKNPFVAQPQHPATAVQRLLDAGMVAAGKTEMVELAVGGWGTNRARGTPWNPWDPEVHRVPGGSSSGSAVAVAAGLVNTALGSDTGGSVRIPAAMCGIVGFKPGWGQISQSGMVPLSPMLDVIGPMASDVETVAAMYLAILDSADVRHRTQQQMNRWQRKTEPTLDGLRIVVPTPTDLADTAPTVRNGLEKALDRLRDQGASLQTIALERPFRAYAKPTASVFLSDGLRLHHDWLSHHDQDMDPWVVRRLRWAKDTSPDVYRQHVDAREPLRKRFCEAWEDAELLVLPTTPITAIPVVDVDETKSTLALYTRPFNYMDLPALAVPMGLDEAGLPMSLQLVGRPGDEGTLLGVGNIFMRAHWRDRQPPLHFTASSWADR